MYKIMVYKFPFIAIKTMINQKNAISKILRNYWKLLINKIVEVKLYRFRGLCLTRYATILKCFFFAYEILIVSIEEVTFLSSLWFYDIPRVGALCRAVSFKSPNVHALFAKVHALFVKVHALFVKVHAQL